MTEKDPMRDAVEEAVQQDIEAAQRALDAAVRNLQAAAGHVKAWKLVEPMRALDVLTEAIELTAGQLARASGALGEIARVRPPS